MNAPRPYGSWPSPITAAHVAAATRKFADLKVDSDDGAAPILYWIESRPEQGGRNTIMCAKLGGSAQSLLEPPLSARSAVHEYGGGAFTVHGGRLWFVNAADQAIWQRDRHGNLTYLTGEHAARFADLQYDPVADRVIAVVETPQVEGEPRASLESVSADGTRDVIAWGYDFYASPRLSPNGDRLVWLAWNHPDMPWDATELWQAKRGPDDRYSEPECLWAPRRASLFGPLFDPAGRLYIVCDADDWWNIYREVGHGRPFEQLTREKAEFGLPQWVFGQSTCAFAADGTLYAMATRDGLWELGRVDTATGIFAPLEISHDYFEQLQVMGDTPVVIAADAVTPKRIVALTVDGPRAIRTGDALPDAAVLSKPESIAWATADRDTAHGLFYRPAATKISTPVDERPPLIIKCHGGPTGATSTAQDARIQYWASRGYALLDVNYRGSTGYGRAYRDKLTGAWGIADVADCVHGARELAARDLIDPSRILISGSSAGGYTVLCVLTFSDVAAAGASYYGIGDLVSLQDSTHKFESRYLKRLIGDDPARLVARSPLYHASQLDCPVLFLQGLKDKVVPPDQAQTMVDSLAARGVAVAYVSFENERHGFRDAANIQHAIEAERSFYTRILGIAGVEDYAALPIENFGS